MVGVLSRSLSLYPCRSRWHAAVVFPYSHQISTGRQLSRCLASVQQAPQHLLNWLQESAAVVQSPPGISPKNVNSSFYTCIMAQADQQAQLKLQLASQLASINQSSSINSSCVKIHSQMGNPAVGAADAIASSTTPATADIARNAGLCQQHIQMPAGFAVPPDTTVPAYQLVGIFRSQLGYPDLPQAARASSLEARWGLLALTLLHAARDKQGFQQQLQQLLDDVLLPQAAQKLRKVMENSCVPEENKLAAQQRFQETFNECSSNITRWTEAACASPAFQELQPVMEAVADRLQISLAAGHHQPSTPGTQSSSSGKLMEKTVLQVLQDALPAGWFLLPSLHLLGADHQLFAGQQGCKYEVDMLILDDQGVAVAVVEVKLGASNPLMALCNDAGSLLKLVELTAGKTVTAITQSDIGLYAAAAAAAADGDRRMAAEPVLAAASASGSSSCNSGSAAAGASALLAKAKAATVGAPFSQGPTWQAVHVKFHDHVLPMYVVGKSIGEAEALKGLSSLVDSSALKLLSQSAAQVRHALLPHDVEQQQQHVLCPGGTVTNSAGIITAPPCSGIEAASAVSLQSTASNSSDGGSSSGGGGSAGSSTRVCVHLTQQQQEAIMEQLNSRMQVLQERCLVYSLCVKP